MGFGWLLVGYFTATMMSLNIIGGVFSLIGYAVSAYGARKLSDYNKRFNFLLFAGVLMAAISVFVAFCDIDQLLYDLMLVDHLIIGKTVDNLFSYIKYCGEFVFTALLCYSVMSIAKETGERKIVYLAIRNFVIACIYYAILVIGWIPTEALRAFAKSVYLPVWEIVLCVLVIVLNSLMLFSCYAKICDESDVDMPAKPRKPSRFAFINEIREEKDRRVERAINSTQKKVDSPYSDVQQKRSAANAKKKRKNK